YLRELPVDIVKIDGSFVKNMTDSPVDQAMLRAMNDIAHALGKQTVAEFVEDDTHLELLKEFKVDYAQGYYIDKPKLICEVFPMLYDNVHSIKNHSGN
ncbi:MAG: EAL domain-containing protein, partial [Thiohalomonadales bacterium]